MEAVGAFFCQSLSGQIGVRRDSHHMYAIEHVSAVDGFKGAKRQRRERRKGPRRKRKVLRTTREASARDDGIGVRIQRGKLRRSSDLSIHQVVSEDDYLPDT